MKYTATIIRASDGRERVHVGEIDGDDAVELLEFMRTEGNHACDCNRSVFFARADGEDEPNDPQCGDTAYRVPTIVTDRGDRIEIDKPPTNASRVAR